MPEGPEVYIMGYALMLLGFDVMTVGKRLYFPNQAVSWSFGLSGGVHIDEDNKLTKLKPFKPGKKYDFIFGEEHHHFCYSDLIRGLGVDICKAPEETIKQVVQEMKKHNKLLYIALKEQNKFFCGIGQFWAEQILNEAGLDKLTRTLWINVDKVTSAIITVRDRALEYYTALALHAKDTKEFINDLYKKTKDMRNKISVI